MNKFRVRRQDVFIETFRIPRNLVEWMQDVAMRSNVYLNTMVVKCCEYAMDNLEEETPPGE